METRQTDRARLFLADSRRSVYTPRRAGYTGFILMASFLLVFLTACSTPWSAGVPASPSAQSVPTLTPTATSTPDPLQAAKTRVLQIMAKMSLEQKLGQLIVVEYIGNNYQEIGRAHV